MLSFFKLKLHNLIADKKFSEILTGSVWALGARVIATGLAMVTSIITARVYGAEVTGIVAMIQFLSHADHNFHGSGDGLIHFATHPKHIAKYSTTASLRGLSQAPVFRGLVFLALNPVPLNS